MCQSATRRGARATSTRPRSLKRRPRREARGGTPIITPQALRARKKFLRIFPKGFRDADYVDLERSYKWNAHLAWRRTLGRDAFAALVADERFGDIAAAAIRIESRTNLLFSFEKIALRDAVRSPAGAMIFSRALFDLLHGDAALETRFTAWVGAIEQLPRRQTRVLTWPLATVFGFIGRPDLFFFFKPTVTREAASRYGESLPYASRPSWPIYRELLAFVRRVRSDIRDLRPRDMIDMQSFLWVQGSEEYPD